eukprot:UN31061
MRSPRPTIIILDHILDFPDEEEEENSDNYWTDAQKQQWKEKITKFIDKLVNKCTFIKLIIASRNNPRASISGKTKKKILSCAHKLIEIPGVGRSSACKIFLHTAPGHFTKNLNVTDLSGHKIMNFLLDPSGDDENNEPGAPGEKLSNEDTTKEKEKVYCPGFIVDICRDLEYLDSAKALDEIKYTDDFADTILDYKK